jgi:hypothetical protein
MSSLPEDWFERVDEILTLASENMKEKLRFQMGFSMGKRKGSLTTLELLENQNILYWDGDQWLSNGKKVHGLAPKGKNDR